MDEVHTLFFSAAICYSVHPWKPVHLDPSCRRWATWMGTGITESHYFFFSVVQYMPTGAGGGGKGRPSSLGEKNYR